MFGRNKKAKQADAQSIPLVLRAADGAVLCAFPPAVVDSLRQMLTGQICNGTLPARMAIVAALRGEGVTYMSLALATTLANDQASTACVVELNWWTPRMLVHLSQGEQIVAPKGKQRKKKKGESDTIAPRFADHPGLANVLAGTATLDEAVIATALPNLALLPAGALSVAQRPVVARSTALRSIITELSRRYDHLIFDIPAVLTTSDAIALASLSDGCYVVVRQGITARLNVQHALDHIKRLPVLGVVLNQVNIQTPRWLHMLIPQE